MRGLKICTRWRAICARRSRRMSSSLLPLNMLPVMTSIQPGAPCDGFFQRVNENRYRRMPTASYHWETSVGCDGIHSSFVVRQSAQVWSGAALILASLRVDADDVAGVDERRAR